MDYNLTVWKDHIKDQSGNVIQQGTPVSSKNLNNMEKGIANLAAQIEANAKLVREATPSGFTTLPELDYAYMSANPNTIKLSSDAVAYVNGYKTVIPAGTVIQLNPPPATGSREDLVFPECWKEVDANGVISWKWRLRAVDGVDFDSYDLDGMSTSAYWWRDDHKILVQGGNSEPLKYTADIDTFYQCYRHSNLSFQDIKVFGDRGLFVVGKGNQASKDILKTADGYVYAIPLFRVSRRNSGGYSVNNGNGGKSCYSITVYNRTVVPAGLTGQWIFSASDYAKISAGDYLGGMGSVDSSIIKIISKDNDSTYAVTIQNFYKTGSATNNSAASYIFLGNRPDCLLADIIAERDIKPLWHQISLTGFNTQQLLEENFDKLLRGELQTKEKMQMLKTYHGVKKTPIDSNTVFYASFDGTTVAEVGGTPSFASTAQYKPSLTGLSANLNETVYDIDFSNLSIATIDFWFYMPLDPNSNSNVIMLDLLDGNLKTLESIAKQWGNHFGGITETAVEGGNFKGFDWNHIRTVYNNTDKSKCKVYVNGKSKTIISTPTFDIKQVKKIKCSSYGNTNAFIADLSISNIDRGDVFATLPKDFIDGYARIAPAFNSQRKVFSDALTSQYTSDMVKASGVNAKQIATTQKTPGVWTTGDTIKVRGLGGEIISGVIDSDTALARVTQDGTFSANTICVDDISRLAVNDTFAYISGLGSLEGTHTITAIDSTNKIVTFTPALNGWQPFAGHILIETTASSSSPVIKFNNAGTITAVTGTWSGLGTNEATFTLGTTTGLNAQDIQIEYSLNMPAGQGGMPEVLTETLAGEYQGKKLVVNPGVHIRDDFAGKQKGSFIECPNIIKNNYGGSDTTLLSPSNVPNEITQGEYSIVSKQDQQCISCRVTVKDAIPQLNVQLSIIREIEDRFGPIPAIDKVAWAKANIGGIEFSVYASALSPMNKVYMCPYAHDGGGYKSVDTKSAASTDMVKLTGSASTYASALIDENGVLSVLAYTDPARITDDTVLALSNHGINGGDIIENTTRNYVGWVSSATANAIGLANSIAGQISGDSIDKFRCTAINKYTEAGTDQTTIKITNHGLSNTHAHYIKNASRGYLGAKVAVIDANTLKIVSGISGAVSAISGQTSGDNIYFYTYQGTQTAENTVIPSQINLDYAYLDIMLKVPQGYDVLAPESPRRDDGKSSMLLVRKETKELQAMFNASNTDGVITYGDYIPKQGLLPSITDGYMLTTPKMCITSLSTKGTNMLIPYGTKNDILDEFLAIDNLISTALTNGANINSAVSTAVSSALINSDIIGNSINYKKVGIGKIKALSSKGGLVIEDSNKGYFVVSVDISKVPKDANVVILSTALIKDSTGNLMMLVIGSSDKLGGYVGQVASSRFLIFNIANRPLVK